MNKVAKEQLGLFKPKKIEILEFNLESRDYLHSVLAQHEQNSFINLGKTMMAAGKGKNPTIHPADFDWLMTSNSLNQFES